MGGNSEVVGLVVCKIDVVTVYCEGIGWIFGWARTIVVPGFVGHGTVVAIVDFITLDIGCVGHGPGDGDSSWCCPEKRGAEDKARSKQENFFHSGILEYFLSLGSKFRAVMGS